MTANQHALERQQYLSHHDAARLLQTGGPFNARQVRQIAGALGVTPGNAELAQAEKESPGGRTFTRTEVEAMLRRGAQARGQ